MIPDNAQDIFAWFAPTMHGESKMLNKMVTVTSKKMITIPSSIMRKYGIKEGSKVQLVELNGAIIMVPVKSLTEMHGMDKAHAKELIEGVRELDREHRKEA